MTAYRRVKTIFIIFRLFFGLCFFLYQTVACAQLIHIRHIVLEGNEQTRSSVVLREMDIKEGDFLTIEELAPRIERNRELLLNTGLFTSVKINIKNWDTARGEGDLLLNLREAWYIYPVPVFELADRNFNTWWVTEKHSLKRVSYGVRVLWTNPTGRRDVLKVTAQTGFTQKYELDYSLPGINAKKTIGVTGNVLLKRDREANYTTQNNRQQFVRNSNSDFVLRRFRLALGLNYRQALFASHGLRIERNNLTIGDTVSQFLNPDFFGNRQRKQSFLSLQYDFYYDCRDLRIFPTHGFFYNLHLQKDGVLPSDNLNALNTVLHFAHYFPLSKKINFEWIGEGRVALLRQKQPFYNSCALGYGDDFLRGYEYIVTDGLDYIYTKTSLRYQLLNQTIGWGEAKWLRYFREIPIRIYFSVNNDFGKANNPSYAAGNSLANQWLWGGGLGLNFVVNNDKLLQIEYSMNQLQQKSVFLHYKLGF